MNDTNPPMTDAEALAKLQQLRGFTIRHASWQAQCDAAAVIAHVEALRARVEAAELLAEARRIDLGYAEADAFDKGQRIAELEAEIGRLADEWKAREGHPNDQFRRIHAHTRGECADELRALLPDGRTE